VLNWELMKHPLNWVIVILMLTIAGIAGHLVLTRFGVEPKEASPATGLPPGEVSREDFAAAILGT
jgi:hypothetical protein